MPVADALRMKSRVAAAVWEAEMLCLRPSRSDSVLPEFDTRLHVVRGTPWEWEWRTVVTGGIDACAVPPSRDDASIPPHGPRLRWYCGMDFGYRNPAAILWAVQNGYFDKVKVESVKATQTKLTEFLVNRKQALLDEIKTKKALDDAITGQLKAAVEEFFTVNA